MCSSDLYYRTDGLTKQSVPDGWHIPTVGDMNDLKSYLMKTYSLEKNIWKTIASNVLWYNSDIENSIGYNYRLNNITGFNLIPAGTFNSNGNFTGFYWAACFWGSTKDHSNDSRFCRIKLQYDSIDNYSIINYDRSYFGYNIRCIKD